VVLQIRFVKRDIKHGVIKLVPENPTDLYVLSNLLEENDQVYAKTSRRVRRSGSESRSGEKSDRVTVSLGIALIDQAFHEFSFQSRLRVKGTIVSGPEELVSLGDTHTLNIEPGLPVKIIKPKWNKYHLQMLEEAEKAATKPKIAIVVIESGHSVLAVVDNYQVHHISTDKHNIPRKAANVKNRKQEVNKFFEKIKSSMNNHLPSGIIALIVAGPGFVKERFFNFIQEEWIDKEVQFILESTGSSGKNGVVEIIRRGLVDKLAGELQVMKEIKLLERFEKLLVSNIAKVTYSLDSVHQAGLIGAISQVILLDTFLRSSRDINIYTKTVEILESVKNTGGEYLIVNERSENGKKIRAFGGAIALLRWELE
jgi:protein pelota